EGLSLPRNACRRVTDRGHEPLQLVQGVGANRRRHGEAHDATGSGVEHPRCDLDGPRIMVRGQTTTNDTVAGPLALSLLVDPDLPATPWVPAVPNDSRLGTMGVWFLASITNDGRHSTLGQISPAASERRAIQAT